MHGGEGICTQQATLPYVALALCLALVSACVPEFVSSGGDCGACLDCGVRCPDTSVTDCGVCRCAEAGQCKCPDAGAPRDCGVCAACGEAGPCKDAGPAKCADTKICADGPPPPPAWPLQIGGPLEDTGRFVRTDGQGNVYVSGSFRATTHVGPKSHNKVITSKGAVDQYLAKLDPTGKVLWTLTIGTKNNDVLSDLAVDAKGNSYIAGSFSSSLMIGTKKVLSGGKKDVYLAKMNPSGVVQWATAAGGAGSDGVLSITLDSSGKLYVLGIFHQAATFGTKTITVSASNKYERFVARLDTAGPTWAWVKSHGAVLRSQRIRVDSWGNILLAGTFNQAVTIAGTALKPKGSHDVFWLRLNSAGSPTLVVSAGGTSMDDLNDLVLDSTGNSYLLGVFNGKSTFGSTTLVASGDHDVYVAKLDPAGKFLWFSKAGGSYDDKAVGITLGSKGSVIISGSFKHLATFGSTKLLAAKDPAVATGSIDIFAAELSASTGVFIGASSAGGHGKDYGNGVAVDSKGTRYVTGKFNGQATFGAAKLTSRGDYDGVVWRLP